MPLKKGEVYHFTVTSASSTETRTDRQKTRAISRIRKMLADANGRAEAILHIQRADETLDAQVSYYRDEEGKITEAHFPKEAPGETLGDPEE